MRQSWRRDSGGMEKEKEVKRWKREGEGRE
jgi:hypothetical protein